MKLAYSLIAVVALTTLPACSGSDGGWCDDVCDCTGDCSPNQHDNCQSNFEDIEKKADREDCSDRYDDAIDCLNDVFECRNGKADTNTERCSDEINKLTRCTGIVHFDL